MATKPKGSTTPRRDRRSGSTSPASVNKRPSKPTTPDNKPSSASSNSSSPTSKPLPNYLRATASSSRHLPSSTKSTLVKKKHNDSETQDTKSPKPTPNRRRSVDNKPPSPSGLRKSLNSPGTEAKDAAHKSKSQSVKTVSNAQKPARKSVTKPMVWQAKKTSSVTGLRRSSSGIPCGSSKDVRSSRCSTSSSKAPRSQDITEILYLEANLDALNRDEAGEVDEIKSIVEDNCEDLPDPEDNVDDQQLYHASVSVDDASSVTDAAEESEANANAENETDIQEEKELDGHHDQVEEADHHISKVSESNDIDQNSGFTSEETKAEEAIDEEKQDEDKNEVEGEDEDVKEEAKADTTTASDKKESAAAYNDVIEETASKLMTQDQNRKNKVQALVGAFETVIDYETAASKP